jgi:hypothetical protein
MGVCALALLLGVTGWKLYRALPEGGDYAVVRFGIYLMTLVANFAESNFACMTPIGFLFLLAAFGQAAAGRVGQVSPEELPEPARFQERETGHAGLTPRGVES